MGRLKSQKSRVTPSLDSEAPRVAIVLHWFQDFISAVCNIEGRQKRLRCNFIWNNAIFSFGYEFCLRS